MGPLAYPVLMPIHGRLSMAQVLFNTYQAPVHCVIQRGGEISSSESTTHGDPLAMAMYALAVRPLIDCLLVTLTHHKAGLVHRQCHWCGHLFRVASMVGYPCCIRTRFWLQSECNQDLFDCQETVSWQCEASVWRHTCQHHCAKKATSGSCHWIQRIYMEKYVVDKVKTWTQEVLLLAEIATSQPHAAYSAFVHRFSSH